MLTIEGLTKTFHLSLHKSIQVQGFKNISFEVPEGQFLGISGPSGIGKSSILKCIYRTYQPSAGHVWFDSNQFGRVDIATAPERLVACLRKTEMSYVTQFLRVIPRVSAVDVVAEPLLSRNVEIENAREKATDLLLRLNIPETLLDAYPATFSGGEQQRVNIARALIAQPKLLILDEPTASLDPHTKNIVIECLAELKQKGTTMIGVFHDWEIMGRVADQIIDLPKLMEQAGKENGDTEVYHGSK